MNKVYICIDLKSFYASVECVLRDLDPLNTNLVVADISRTEKTICLAVSPSLKSYGIPGRARLFEVISKVKEINSNRLRENRFLPFSGKSYIHDELINNKSLALDYICATPHMKTYMDVSNEIYKIYLKYFDSKDIHVYSIDEVFIDASSYMNLYNNDSLMLARKIIKEIYDKTGITATGGIGTNMYLAKIAMDIEAKHMDPDENGVRIAYLDELTYRKNLWTHEPLSDFWRVGKGYVKRLNELKLYTMGDICRCSIGSPDEFYNEELLYKEFGINAEFLIDHAWGFDDTTMFDIKAYKPKNNSFGVGQVIHCPVDYNNGLLIVKEMTDQFVLDLIDKHLITDQIVLQIGYDISNLENLALIEKYDIEIVTDYVGRQIPKPAHGTINFKRTQSLKIIMDRVCELYRRIVDPHLLIRRVNISGHIYDEDNIKNEDEYQKISLFDDIDEIKKNEEAENKRVTKELKRQKAILDIKKKYGKNAVVKGMNLEEGGTMIDRNKQIGGHKA